MAVQDVDSKNLLIRHIFRASDIRGIYPNEITPELFFNLGKCLAAIITDSKDPSTVRTVQRAKILVGYDSRASSKILFDALLAGLHNYSDYSRLQVINLGLVTTPILYYAGYYLSVPNTCMVTASHCPSNYNGLKIKIYNKPAGPWLWQQIYKIYKYSKFKPISNIFYKNYKTLNIFFVYYSLLKKKFHAQSLKNKYFLIIDTGNGTTAKFCRNLLKNLGYEFKIINEQITCQPKINLNNLKQEILACAHLKNKYNLIGLAFDGDGDRCQVVDDNGQIITTSEFIVPIVKYLSQKAYRYTVIHDVQAYFQHKNYINYRAYRNCGYFVSPCGYSSMLRQLTKFKADLGFEQSGHVFLPISNCNNPYVDDYIDDGIYTGLMLIKALDILGEKISDYKKLNFYKKKYTVSELNKFTILKKIKNKLLNLFKTGRLNSIFADYTVKINITDGIRIDFSKTNFNSGFWVIRASNTSNCLVIHSAGLADNTKQQICAIFTEINLSLC